MLPMNKHSHIRPRL